MGRYGCTTPAFNTGNSLGEGGSKPETDAKSQSKGLKPRLARPFHSPSGDGKTRGSAPEIAADDVSGAKGLNFILSQKACIYPVSLDECRGVLAAKALGSSA
jgi:hypothetical protein